MGIVLTSLSLILLSYGHSCLRFLQTFEATFWFWQGKRSLSPAQDRQSPGLVSVGLLSLLVVVAAAVLLFFIIYDEQYVCMGYYLDFEK